MHTWEEVGKNMIRILLSFLSHLSRREKLIFYGALTVLGFVLLDRLMLNPIVSEMRLLDEKISNKKASIKEALHIISQKDRLGKETRIYAIYLEGASSDEEEIFTFLKYIENLAGKSSVSLMDIKRSGIKEEILSKKYFIRLSCEAQVEQIIDFFYNIESSNMLLLRIEKWNIAPKAEGSSIINCTMDISKFVIL